MLQKLFTEDYFTAYFLPHASISLQKPFSIIECDCDALLITFFKRLGAVGAWKTFEMKHDLLKRALYKKRKNWGKYETCCITMASGKTSVFPSICATFVPF